MLVAFILFLVCLAFGVPAAVALWCLAVSLVADTRRSLVVSRAAEAVARGDLARAQTQLQKELYTQHFEVGKLLERGGDLGT